MMSEISTFKEALGAIENDKRLDKLEDYQKYQLALEVMKSNEFYQSIKACTDKIVDILDKISPEIFTAIESLSHITVDFANEDIFPDFSQSQIDSKNFGRKVRFTSAVWEWVEHGEYRQKERKEVTSEGILIGINGAMGIIETDFGQITLSNLRGLKFIDQNDGLELF